MRVRVRVSEDDKIRNVAFGNLSHSIQKKQHPIQTCSALFRVGT